MDLSSDDVPELKRSSANAASKVAEATKARRAPSTERSPSVERSVPKKCGPCASGRKNPVSKSLAKRSIPIVEDCESEDEESSEEEPDGLQSALELWQKDSLAKGVQVPEIITSLLHQASQEAQPQASLTKPSTTSGDADLKLQASLPTSELSLSSSSKLPQLQSRYSNQPFWCRVTPSSSFSPQETLQSTMSLSTSHPTSVSLQVPPQWQQASQVRGLKHLILDLQATSSTQQPASSRIQPSGAVDLTVCACLIFYIN